MNYWEEALGQSLSEAGCFTALTPEQLKEVAAGLKVWAEMEGESTGRYSIPDPHIAEMKRIEERHKRELAESEERADIYKREGCRIAGVDPNRVYINNGAVWRV